MPFAVFASDNYIKLGKAAATLSPGNRYQPITSVVAGTETINGDDIDYGATYAAADGSSEGQFIHVLPRGLPVRVLGKFIDPDTGALDANAPAGMVINQVDSLTVLTWDQATGGWQFSKYA